MDIATGSLESPCILLCEKKKKNQFLAAATIELHTVNFFGGTAVENFALSIKDDIWRAKFISYSE